MPQIKNIRLYEKVLKTTIHQKIYLEFDGIKSKIQISIVIPENIKDETIHVLVDKAGCCRYIQDFYQKAQIY